MKPRLVVALTIIAVLGVGAGTYRFLHLPDAPPQSPGAVVIDERTGLPEGVRIRIAVMNATSVRGLARRATQVLRDAGFDVVETGNSRTPRDSVVVIDHTGHPEWARLAALALGGARIESRADTTRFLDLTILVGSAWRPPAQPFYP